MPLPCDWQTTTQKIAQRGQYLLETGKWSDCKFIVGQEPHQQILEGHKVFLAMSSPVFEAMFYGTMAEKNDPIPIRDVQPEAFKALMEYIYTDRVDLGSFELACELCYCAKKYMLPFLVEECTKFLWSDLSLKKACRAYEFAKLFEEPVLMEKCLQIICSKTDEVLKESSWDEVEQGTVLTLLDQEELHITSETDLFNALERWAKAECTRKSIDASDPKALKSVIGNALTKIRFLTLTPQEFADGPGKSPLLTQEEAFSILMNISSNKSKVPMPEAFSLNINARTKSRIEKISGSARKSTEMSLNIPQNSFRIPLFLIPDSNYPDVIQEENQDVSRESPDLSVELPMYILNNHMRDGPKIYCYRPLIEQTDCQNTDVIDSSVSFSVDSNIFVLGVQVPSQILNVSDCYTSFGIYQMHSDRTYTEVLYAHLLDSHGTRLTYTHYTTKAALSELVEISFNQPVFIQKNKTYKIGVVFNKPGRYPTGNCVQRVMCRNVSFSFHNDRDVDYHKDGLIRSIVFQTYVD